MSDPAGKPLGDYNREVWKERYDVALGQKPSIPEGAEYEDCYPVDERGAPTATSRSAREYAAKIWNLPETPGMFHRQAPGLPMTTRCGLVMGREARSTAHSLAEFNACPVCFEGWGA